MACASIPSPTMFPSRDFLAITDPTAATDNLNVLDDVFASSFLRPRNTSRSTQSAISPRILGFFNPSPRIPSALPPSASPGLAEPLTPDRSQSVLPFYDVGDFNPQSPRAAAREAEREKERRRRLAWANDLPPRPAHHASTNPSSAVDVVDEAAADRLFSAVPRMPRSQLARSSPPISLSAPEPRATDNDSDHLMPDLPTMHLNLAPIRSPNAPPGPSPFSGARDLSPVWGVPTPLPDHRAVTAPTPSPSVFARDAIGSWVCQTRTAKQPDVPDLSLPVKHASEPARPFATSPGLPTTFNPAAFLNTNSNPSPSANSPQDPASTSAPPKKPRRPDLNDPPSAKMEEVVTPINMFPTPTPTSMDEIRSPQVPPPGPVQLQLPHMRPVQPQPQSQSLASRGLPARGHRTVRHRTPRTEQSPDTVGTDPLQCGRCRQRFARRSNLFKHQRSVHVKLRPFPCPLCPMKFKRRDHLNKHKRSVHAGIRQYTCEICGVGFAEKFNRDKHRNGIHHTKRAIRCPCGAYFRDRDNMLNCLRCKRLSGLQRAGL